MRVTYAPLHVRSPRRPDECGGATITRDCEMWLYVQMWFLLLAIALTASICFTVVSFIMGQEKFHR
jgi:hypothetical protein